MVLSMHFLWRFMGLMQRAYQSVASSSHLLGLEREGLPVRLRVGQRREQHLEGAVERRGRVGGSGAAGEPVGEGAEEERG